MPVVFGNSLGTDFRLWDQLLPLLPDGLKIVRFDKRGHGLSSCPGDAYTMDELVDDTAQLLRALEIRDCLFVGLSIGGLIAQGLAANHPELVRAIVISNSAARVGTPQLWGERIAILREGGIEAIADNIMQRWFAESFRRERAAEVVAWRNMLTRTPLAGYIGCSAAIAATDFSAASASRFDTYDRLDRGFARLTWGSENYFRAVGATSWDAAGRTWLGGAEVQFSDGPWENPEDVRRYNGFLKYSTEIGGHDAEIMTTWYSNDWNATDQIPLRAVERGDMGRFGFVDPSVGGETSGIADLRSRSTCRL